MPALTNSLFSPIESANQSATEAARAVANSVTRGFNSTLGAAENVGKRIAGTLGTVGATAKQLGENIIERGVEVVGEVMTRARGVVVSLGQSLVSGLLSLRSTVITSLAGVVGSVAGALGTLGSWMSGLLRTLSGALRAASSPLVGVGAVLSGLMFGFSAALVSLVRNGFSFITGGIASAFSVVKGLATSVASVVLGVISGTVSALGSLISSAASAGPVGIGIALALVGLLGNFALAFLSKTLTLAAGAMSYVGRLLTAIPAFLAPIWSSVSGAVGGITGALTGAIKTGLGAVVNIARSAFTALASWASAAYSWASSLTTRAFGFVASNIGPVVSALGSLASTALSLGVGFAKILGIGTLFAAFAAAVYAASKAAMEFAQNSKTLGAMTGFGTGKSAGILNNFGAQGIGAQSVTSAFGNQSPFAFGLKARAFNLPNFDSADFGEQLAKRFQSLNARGPMGNILARSMMRTLGLDSPEWLRLASTGAGTQRANAGFARNIHSNLGLDPRALAKYAEAIPALVTRIGVAFNGMLMKIANEALPMIEGVLNAATKIIGQNAGQIGSLIAGAVEWMFVRAPVILMEGVTTVLAITATALQTLVGWGQWIVTTLPAVLEAGAQTIGDTLRAWSIAFGEWAPTFIDGFAGFLAGTGKVLGEWISGVGGFIADQMSGLANWMQSVWSDQNNPMRVMVMEIARGLDKIIAAAKNFVGQTAATGAHLSNVVLSGIMGLPGGALVAAGMGLTPKNPYAAAASATAGIGIGGIEDVARRFFAGPTIPRGAATLAGHANNLRASSTNAAAGLESSMGDLANNARMKGNSVAGGITSGLTSLGNRFSSADGKQNMGRDLGGFLSESLAPGVAMLSQLSQGVTNLSNAAQAYKQSLGTEDERRGRWAEMIAAQKETTQAIKDTAMTGGNLGAGVDAIAGYMLKSFAQEQGRAVRSYGGGGTS